MTAKLKKHYTCTQCYKLSLLKSRQLEILTKIDMAPQSSAIDLACHFSLKTDGFHMKRMSKYMVKNTIRIKQSYHR